MTYARKSLVCLNDTPYYHVIARCVRRAWLCGFDEYAGKDYSHRKEWVLERLAQLSKVFSIEICAYAVMSNHYHLVIHIDRKRAQAWHPQEVVDRWCTLFSKSPLIGRWLRGECGDAEREVAESVVECWRGRLCDISWYMRCLNEHLARRANIEDGCNGRFWQGRFKSQALVDEAGLLTAMAYVDLNPIRAGIASAPEESEFTSIYERIRELTLAEPSKPSRRRPPLMKFRSRQDEGGDSIPFDRAEYLELVDWSGRQQLKGKGGSIDSNRPALMERLKLDPENWNGVMRRQGNVFGRAMGRLERLRSHAAALSQCWIRGMYRARRLFG